MHRKECQNDRYSVNGICSILIFLQEGKKNKNIYFQCRKMFGKWTLTRSSILMNREGELRKTPSIGAVHTVAFFSHVIVDFKPFSILNIHPQLCFWSEHIAFCCVAPPTLGFLVVFKSSSKLQCWPNPTHTFVYILSYCLTLLDAELWEPAGIKLPAGRIVPVCTPTKQDMSVCIFPISFLLLLLPNFTSFIERWGESKAFYSKLCAF